MCVYVTKGLRLSYGRWGLRYSSGWRMTVYVKIPVYIYDREIELIFTRAATTSKAHHIFFFAYPQAHRTPPPPRLPGCLPRRNSGSWDTVVQAAASPPRFDGNSHHPAPLGYFDAGYDWRNVARRAASATAAPTTCATPGLLSVDVMELAEGRGFAGDMAPVVESTRGCTYRVVVVVRGDDGGGGEGGCRDKVSVHVSEFFSSSRVCADAFRACLERSAGRAM